VDIKVVWWCFGCTTGVAAISGCTFDSTLSDCSIGGGSWLCQGFVAQMVLELQEFCFQQNFGIQAITILVQWQELS